MLQPAWLCAGSAWHASGCCTNYPVCTVQQTFHLDGLRQLVHANSMLSFGALPTA